MLVLVVINYLGNVETQVNEVLPREFLRFLNAPAASVVSTN
jgi:hypothetical protein